MKKKQPAFPPISEIRRLLVALKRGIADDYRCSDDPEDDKPGMCVTIGASGLGRSKWSYQTGDNSFMGGAYGYPHWAVIYLYRDSNCHELARDAIEQLLDVSFYAFSES